MAVCETARADDFQLADLRHEAALRFEEAAVPTKARKVLSYALLKCGSEERR